MHYWIAVNSQIICHTVTIMFTLMYAGRELFATSILTHLAYLMYRCYHLKSEMSKKTSSFLFRCYTAYASITLIILFFVTIAYDWRTGNGKYTLLENGHCDFINQHSYKTLFFSGLLSPLTSLFKSRCFQFILSTSTSSMWISVLHRSHYNTTKCYSGLPLLWGQQLVLHISFSYFVYLFQNILTLSPSVLLLPCSSNKLWLWFPSYVQKRCLPCAKHS